MSNSKPSSEDLKRELDRFTDFVDSGSEDETVLQRIEAYVRFLWVGFDPTPQRAFETLYACYTAVERSVWEDKVEVPERLTVVNGKEFAHQVQKVEEDPKICAFLSLVSETLAYLEKEQAGGPA
jgi:hypothetical protein